MIKFYHKLNSFKFKNSKTHFYVTKIAQLCKCLPHYALNVTMKNIKNVLDKNDIKLRECTLSAVMDENCMNSLSAIKSNIEPKSCDCPRPCSVLRYDTRSSFSQFPGQSLVKNFKYHKPNVYEFLKDAQGEIEAGEDPDFDQNLGKHLRNNLVMLDIQGGFLKMSYFGVKHGHLRAFLGQKT